MFSIERSGYYAWLKKEPSKRQRANQALDQKITRLFEQHRGRSGSPRITKDLHEMEEKCSKNRVARRMKVLGLHAKAKKKFKVTTGALRVFIRPMTMNALISCKHLIESSVIH